MLYPRTQYLIVMEGTQAPGEGNGSPAQEITVT